MLFLSSEYNEIRYVVVPLLTRKMCRAKLLIIEETASRNLKAQDAECCESIWDEEKNL